MASNVVNMVPYLRTSRNFPEDIKSLTVELNKSYVDVANAVNLRTIGIFPTVHPAITGESFFLNNQRQQSLRQVYTFTTTTAINHKIPITEIPYISRMYGQFTDGTNWYSLIPASNIAIAGQISFYLTPTQIVFVTGGGAPTLTKGIIVIEWLSNI